MQTKGFRNIENKVDQTTPKKVFSKARNFKLWALITWQMSTQDLRGQEKEMLLMYNCNFFFDSAILKICYILLN